MMGQAESLIKMKSLLQSSLTIYNNVFSFTSGKGGTGKSFVALNCAWLIAQRGIKVLLIDLDITNANIHLLLNQVPALTLKDYFSGKKLFSEIVTFYDGKLDIIFGTSYYNNYSNLYSSIQKGISLTYGSYDCIILDIGPGINEFSSKIIPLCSNNIIVTTPEPTAVMDAYTILKMLKQFNYTGVNHLLINKCIEKEDGTITFDNLLRACRHFLKTEIKKLGEISYDQVVMTSTKHQELLVKKNAQHYITIEIQKISNLMVNNKSIGEY